MAYGSPCPYASVVRQRPPAHEPPHVAPHLPQSFTSVWRSTHTPSQTVPGHTQVPASFTWPHAGAATGHTTGPAHCPSDVHVSIAVPASAPSSSAHRMVEGMHGTQAPARHVGRLPEHGAPTGCHVPAAVHVCGCSPSQLCSPSEHAPLDPDPLLDPELLSEPDPLLDLDPPSDELFNAEPPDPDPLPELAPVDDDMEHPVHAP